MNSPNQRLDEHSTRAASIAAYLPLVRRIARRLRERAPQLEPDELVSAGTIGLIEAVDRFDDGFGVGFTTYAYPRIEGAIFDEIRRLVKGRRDDPAGAARPLSLESPPSGENDLTLREVTADPFAVDPGDYAEVCEVVEAVGSLPARQREMLRLAVGGLTGVEIARAFGCSEAWASQLLARARVQVEERTAA